MMALLHRLAAGARIAARAGGRLLARGARAAGRRVAAGARRARSRLAAAARRGARRAWARVQNRIDGRDHAPATTQRRGPVRSLELVTCPDCDGTGRRTWTACPTCRGRGTVYVLPAERSTR